MSKFKDFVQSLFPGEAAIIRRFQTLVDEDKKEILQQVIECAGNQQSDFETDPKIDKRKYSYIKAWCTRQLKVINVDERLSWLMKLEESILSDNIQPGQEKEFLHTIRDIRPGDFNFVKYYEIGRLYRHYLQIRFRAKETELVTDFLNKYRYEYEVGRQLNDKIHQATGEIMQYYSKKKDLNSEWVDILSSIFFNESNDGYTRLLAWIRLVFIANSSNEYTFLQEHFKLFEARLTDGTFYSRRIMANFYSQYLLFYAHQHDFTTAAYYGRLSIKLKNNDYLYYSNNLVAVLLRAKKPAEALEQLKKTASLASASSNFHNKLTHLSYYIRALTDSGKPVLGESKGFVFHNLHKNEIFNYRWHLFFTAWMRAMVYAGKYSQIVRLIRFYPRLLTGEAGQIKIQGGFPILQWISDLVKYKTGDLPLEDLVVRYSAIAISHGGTYSEEATELGKAVLGRQWSLCAKSD